jgi:UDP-glucose 4-epimerase
VIESAQRVTGRSIKVVETSRRSGDAAVLIASSQKIREELGWIPRHPELDTIIGSAWDWMQRRPKRRASETTEIAK